MTQQKESPATLAGAAGESKKHDTQGDNLHEPHVENKQAPSRQNSPISWPSLFIYKPDGIYKVKVESGKPVETWICSPLIIEAQTCDDKGRNWGLYLIIQSPDGRWKRWIMPMQLAGSRGGAYRDILLDFGLRMSPDAEKHIHNYLLTARPEKLLRCVPNIGWHDGAYILPDITFGANAESIILQPDAAESLFHSQGSLEDWQLQVGWHCQGNSRLVFAVCGGIAATLLQILGLESGGFHFIGSSSIGKSVLLTTAGSTVGGGGVHGFLRRWRATDNAIESIATSHNDSLLCLDEIGQVSPFVAASVSYMLANGQSKARADKNGLARPLSEWRILFFSNGELSLEQKIQESGGRHMAGQAVRVLDIPADAGAGYGIFENLHDFADGKAFAEHLQYASTRFFGSPLRAFWDMFTARLENNRENAKQLLKEYEQRLCSDKNDGQVNRAAKRFALLAVAGELAVSFGVFPWEEEEAFNAAQTCFRDWVAFRGGRGALEAREAIRRVRAFISAHRSSRFEEWEKDKGPDVAHNSVGFRREKDGRLEFMVTRDAFRKELCLGGEPKTIAAALAAAGYLETDNEGNFMKSHTPPRIGKTTRFYTINGAIMDADD